MNATEFEHNRKELINYTRIDSYYFEDITLYKPKNDYKMIVENILNEWKIEKDRIFYLCIPPKNIQFPKHGWKIHLSSTNRNAKDILKIAAKICKNYETSFKFLADEFLRDINADKATPRGYANKFITIYPESEETFIKLMNALYAKLKSFEGPYILSDRRFKDCKVLYYRYGTFYPDYLTTSDGKKIPYIKSPDGKIFLDIRRPYFQLPEWIKDPFEPPEQLRKSGNSNTITLKNGRYEIKKALHFSTAGGVYLAFDKINNKEVIVKEARPYTLTVKALDNKDAVSLLKREYKILNMMSGSNVAPKPIDLFQEWEHTFLVEEYIEGRTIDRFVASESIILYHPNNKDIHSFYDTIKNIALKLCNAIKKFHDKNIIINDLSPNNIIITNDNDVKIIDLESAFEYTKEKRINFYTLEYTHKSIREGKEIGFRSDLYSLGIVLFNLVSSTSVFKNLKGSFIREMLHSISIDYGLPTDFIEIIDNLTNYKEKYKNIDEVISDIQNIDLNKNKMGSINTCSKSLNLEDTIFKTCKQIISSSDINKKDGTFFKNYPIRLNDFNIAHGDLGVLFALNYVGYHPSINFLKPLQEKINNVEYIAPGLYTGLAGMAWAMYELGEKRYSLTLIDQANKSLEKLKDFTIYSGLAGIGLANLYFWFQTRNDDFLKKAKTISNRIIENAIETKNGIYWMKNSEVTDNGYFHGSSGIALFLLYLYKITGKGKYLSYCKKALNYDISQTIPFKNVISLKKNKNEQIVLPYLGIGTAGIIITLSRLIKFDNNIENYYVEKFNELINDCERKYTASPGLFMGLAGIGNTLIDCYQLLEEDKYLNLAYEVAESILLYRVEIEDGYGFPSDTLLRISNDFGTGSSGIIMFLNRLINNKPNFIFTLDEYIINFKETNKIYI